MYSSLCTVYGWSITALWINIYPLPDFVAVFGSLSPSNLSNHQRNVQFYYAVFKYSLLLKNKAKSRERKELYSWTLLLCFTWSSCHITQDLLSFNSLTDVRTFSIRTAEFMIPSITASHPATKSQATYHRHAWPLVWSSFYEALN